VRVPVRVPGPPHLRSSVTSSFLRRATARPAVPALALAFTVAVGGTVARQATDKTVTLTVDGEQREVEFRGDTTADVLAAAGLDAGERDLLVPAADAEIEDGDQVALQRARELQLTVDGQPRTVWVTASSVDEALDQVGLREQGLALSASRSRDIPLDGLSLEVTTPKAVQVVADGKTQQLSTTALTSGEALDEAGVQLDADDRLSHDRSRPVVEGLKLTVTRMETTRREEPMTLPFATERREDSSLYVGDSKVLQAGQQGAGRRTVERVYADGRLQSSKVISRTTDTPPTPRIVAIGTQPKPEPKPQPVQTRSSSSSSGGGSSAPAGGGFAALAQCESGGNPGAVSRTGKYRGLYQFSRETWASVGGSGDPASASVAEQTKRAQMLLSRSGAGQWPECGRHLR
jgi:uncharacterized protein YabE (DUF348 family)